MGPNTGGMGAYCPTPLVTPQMLEKIEEKILVPTVHQMKRSRRPFRGVLYAGLMVTSQGIKVLEYNVRFGDPECQPLLMRLKSDFIDANLRGSIAIALGNEADGLTDAWDRAGVDEVSLPMHGIADSLNVSVTAAVLLYEARRQRGGQGAV